MNIVLLSGVRQMLPAPAISLVLLTLLALGTFLAGVNFLSFESVFWDSQRETAMPARYRYGDASKFLNEHQPRDGRRNN